MERTKTESGKDLRRFGLYLRKMIIISAFHISLFPSFFVFARGFFHSFLRSQQNHEDTERNIKVYHKMLKKKPCFAF